jgi:hypothetical protein
LSHVFFKFVDKIIVRTAVYRCGIALQNPARGLVAAGNFVSEDRATFSVGRQKKCGIAILEEAG